MDEIAEYRARKMSERYNQLDREFQLARTALSEAKEARSGADPEQNRQQVLVALRTSIELLEQMHAVELYMQDLNEGDEDWKAKVEHNLSTTNFQLGILYAGNFGHLSPYGFAIDEL